MYIYISVQYCKKMYWVSVIAPVKATPYFAPFPRGVPSQLL